jgi:hypothetical protein
MQCGPGRTKRLAEPPLRLPDLGRVRVERVAESDSPEFVITGAVYHDLGAKHNPADFQIADCRLTAWNFWPLKSEMFRLFQSEICNVSI